MKTSLLLLPLLLFITLSTSGQPTGTADELLPGEGTEFRFGFLQNEEQTSACAVSDPFDRAPTIVITLSSRFYATADVYFRGELLETASIFPGRTVSVQASGGSLKCIGENLCDQTFHVVANNPIQIQATSYEDLSMEAAQIIPVREWGRDYVAITLPLDYYAPDSLRDPRGCLGEPRQGEIGIVAGEDSTLVVVIPTVDTRGGMVAGKRYERLLMAGELWQIQDGGTERGRTDLSGTGVTANRPIGVFTGHVRVGIPIERETKNHLFEALPAADNNATTYHAAPLYGIGSVDRLRIINPGAVISIVSVWFQGTDGPVLVMDTLESFGSWLDLELDGPVTIEATRPVQVAQFTQSDGHALNEIGDPSMVMLTPISRYGTSATFQSIPFQDAGTAGPDTIFHYGSAFVDSRSLEYLILGGMPVLDSPWLLDYREIPAGPDAGTSYTWLHFEVDPDVGKTDLRGAEQMTGYVAGAAHFDAYATSASHLLADQLIEGNVAIGDLEFGSVEFGTTLCLAVTMTNNNSVPVTFDVVESDEQFSLVSGTLPLTLMPRESREIGVCFTPDAYGRITGELALRSTSTGLRVVSALSGTGVDGPTSVEERADRSSGITWTRIDNSLRVRFSPHREIEGVRLYSLTGEFLSGTGDESLRSGLIVLYLPESLASGVYYLVISERNDTEPIVIRLNLH